MSFTSQPTPSLEAFYFKPFIGFTDDSKRDGVIPETLFVDSAPSLKDIHLACVAASPYMPILKTIARISLNGVHGLTSLHQFIGGSSSNLEALELVFSIQSLFLQVAPRVLITIMEYTDMPRVMDWRIDFGDLVASRIDIEPLAPSLQRSEGRTY